MTQYKAGVIGCGNRGCRHAEGYQAAAQVEIVACADPVEAARSSFAEDFAVASSYEDYRAMLESEALDVVSVCTWTGLHREMVEAAAAAGVKAIHCEKPMASTWGDAKALAQACADRDVLLTFSHQRRFGAPFVKAKQLLDAGAIGALQRLEGACSNLFDWGTHWFDMFFFYNDEVPGRVGHGPDCRRIRELGVWCALRNQWPVVDPLAKRRRGSAHDGRCWHDWPAQSAHR